VGSNGAGKSTLGFTGIQAIWQGISEKATAGTTPILGERFRFIGSAGATSKNELVLVDEKRGNSKITVRRKITKTGSELTFEAPEGYPDTLDQNWLNTLFNIFLIAPKKFQELSGTGQAKALGIDTVEFDTQLTRLKAEHTLINRDLKQFSGMAVEPVEKIDIEVLQSQRAEKAKSLNDQYKANKETNKAVKKQYDERWKSFADKKAVLMDQVKEYAQKADHCLNAESILVKWGYTGTEVNQWITSELLFSKNMAETMLNDLSKTEPQPPTDLSDMPEDYKQTPENLYYIKETPDSHELIAIDERIAAAYKVNEKFLLYQQYLERKTAKEAKEKELSENKTAQAKIEFDRLEYIKTFKFPFSNLTVGEDGDLLLNGKPIKEPYFSTGELIKIIPILISTSNPELKYVFIQDFNLLDEDKQKEVESYLVDKGFQLVIEIVGKSKLPSKNCILLKDNVVVENYEESKPVL
jgi:hypothetical protein